MLLVLVVALWSVAAMADEGVEEITVTAERRENVLERVPLSIDVVHGHELDASGLATTSDLSFRIPGMVFTTNVVMGQPYIRGVGTDLISLGADASIATFVDDVYQARSTAALQDLYDVERVEVLKGPQGALYGRNATGGAIRILTKEPGDELEAGADLSYGNFDALRLRGYINAPLVEEAVFARLSGQLKQRDGYSVNLLNDRELDDEDTGSLRGKVLMLPAEGVSLLVSADYTRDQSTRGLAPKLVEPLDSSPAYQMGGTVPADPRQLFHDTWHDAERDMWGTSARLDWQLDTISISALSAFRETGYELNVDIDLTEIPLISNTSGENSSVFTQDIQLTSSGDAALQWLGGLLYLHEDGSQFMDVTVASTLDQTGADVQVDAFELFGELSYAFSESWRATAGLRYSKERKRIDFVERVNGSVAAAFERSDDWDAWTPRFVLEYVPTDDLLFYASASRGFKSGGYNATRYQPDPFDPEFLWAFEVGSRASPWDGRLRLHAALFYYDYEDIQVHIASSLGTILPEVVNAGAATIRGAELDGQARLFAALTLEGAVALLDARFDDLMAVNPHDPAGSLDQSGNRLPKAPEFSAWLAAEYALPLPFGMLTPRVEYRFQSEIYFDLFENPDVRQGAYGLWNARLSFEDREQHFFAALFARNLGDELYRQNNISSPGVFGNLAFWGAPRTYGLEVGARY